MSRWIAVLLAVVLAPAVAHAGRTLTLSDAFRLANQGNLDMRAARSRVDEASIGIRQAISASSSVYRRFRISKSAGAGGAPIGYRSSLF